MVLIHLTSFQEHMTWEILLIEKTLLKNMRKIQSSLFLRKSLGI